MQLNHAERWLFGGGWVTVICLILAIASPYFLIASAAALIAATLGFATNRIALEYDTDPEITRWFDALVEGWPQLAATKGRWRVQSKTALHRTHHRKINAGASNLVSRTRTHFRLRPPLVLSSNIKVPTVRARTHSLLFLPDRVLVRSGRHWSDVLYEHLQMSVSQGRFIESSMASVPRDGTQVGERWQYTNVKGGPDRRFKNNRRLPVMLYSYVDLASASGLNWNFQLSRHDPAKWWQQVVHERPCRPVNGSEPPVD
jgi:DNA polymerase-3 subunit epsilon